MSHVQPSPGQGEPARRDVDADFFSLRRVSDPLVLLARARPAYIFVFEGFGAGTWSIDGLPGGAGDGSE
jgi:hypothetical protein